VEALGTWSGSGAVDGAAEAEFQRVWREHFLAGHDPSGLACEHNVLRYRPLPTVGLFVADDADPAAVELAHMAARVAGVRVQHLGNPATEGLDRVRVVGSLTGEQWAKCHAAGVEVDRVQPVADALAELRHWVREQAVSTTRHRHGRLLD